MNMEYRHVFGPVPSRRLGHSLGVDLVPFKTCTYDCVYCQLGRTTNRTLERREYVPLDEVLDEIRRKLDSGKPVDVITLSGSGEPTLFSRTGDLIVGIKKITGKPVAVLTNGSLLWDPAVREDLRNADIVVPSLDAGDETLFRSVNRPHPDLGFARMTRGLADFRNCYAGKIWLEVFLLGGVTGLESEVRKIAAVAETVRPDEIHLNTVTRPPAESFAYPVPEMSLNRFKSLFAGTVKVIGKFHNAAPGPETGAVPSEIIALLARRPCSLDDVASGLNIHRNEAVKILEELERSGKVSVIRQENRFYYAIPGNPGAES